MDPVTIALLSGGINILGMGLNYSAQMKQRRAILRRAEFQRDMANLNSRFSMLSAESAIKKGYQSISNLRTQTNQLTGNQRLALAAQGIDIDSGSAKDIQEETRALSKRDELTIKSNAYKQALGFKIDAKNQRMQANINMISARTDAKNITNNAAAQTMFSAAKMGLEYFGG